MKCLLCNKKLKEEDDIIVLEGGTFAEEYNRGSGTLAPASHYPQGENGFIHDECWCERFSKKGSRLHPDRWM